MRKLLLPLFLLLCLLLAACGAEPAEILLTPLEETGAAAITEEPELSVTVRTPFGRAVPAELPAPAPSEDLTRLPPAVPDGAEINYVLNTNSRRFHLPDCSSVAEMKSANRQDFTGTREELLAMGYQPCGRCKP